MNEYSITYEELREIIDLIASGWQCDKLEDGYTLYIKLTKGDKNKELILSLLVKIGNE